MARKPSANFNTVSSSITILKANIFSRPNRKPFAIGLTIEANTTTVNGSIYIVEILATSAMKSPSR